MTASQQKPEQPTPAPTSWLWQGLTFPKASAEYGYPEDTLRDAANTTCGPRLKTIGNGGGKRVPRKFLHEWIERVAS